MTAQPFTRLITSGLCSECNIYPATTEVEAGPSGTSLLITAYSVESLFPSGSFCFDNTPNIINLNPPLSITEPSSADPLLFTASAQSDFLSYVGLSLCANGFTGEVFFDAIYYGLPSLTGPNSTQHIATTISATASTSAPDLSVTRYLSSATPKATAPILSSANVSLAPTSTADTRNNPTNSSTKKRIAIGVVVTAIVITTIIEGAIYMLRRRKRRQSREKVTAPENSSVDVEPYLQRKAELEAEERRRLELEAVEARYEMDGDDYIREIQGAVAGNEIDNTIRAATSSLKKRQELRGIDSPKELEATLK